MRFRVLGPLEVWDEGAQVELGSADDRALLALLLLHRNEVLSVEQIGEALEADAPAISRLRSTLGSEAVVMHPWGYGLRVPPGGVDADEFAALVERARDEDPAVAVTTLEKALSLWRGPAFADVAHEPFIQEEVARLELARRTAEREALDLSTHGRRLADDPDPEPVQERQQRWRPVAAAAALAVAATIVAVWGISRGEARHVVVGPNMVAALDPKTNRVVDAFRVGSVPTQLAIGGPGIWVLNANDHTVSRIDTSTRTVRTVGISGNARSLAAGPESGWIANGWRGTVSRIDERSGEVARTIRLPGRRYTGAALIAATRSEVWATGFTLPAGAPSPFKRPVHPMFLPPTPEFLVWRIDPRTNDVARTVPIKGIDFNARSVLVAGDSLWVRRDDGLLRFDRRTFQLEHRLVLPSNGCCEFAGMAVGAGSVWVAGLARGVLWRIDSRGDAITATIPLRGNRAGLAVGEPAGVAVGGGFVWVADATGGVLKIDPTTNEVVDRLPIAGVPHAIAFGFGRVWVALA